MNRSAVVVVLDGRGRCALAVVGFGFVGDGLGGVGVACSRAKSRNRATMNPSYYAGLWAPMPGAGRLAIQSALP
jgi:hypothetical protein